jgi:hypothetical protein
MVTAQGVHTAKVLTMDEARHSCKDHCQGADRGPGAAIASPMRHTFQLQGQREAPVSQLSRSCRGEENGEVEVTGVGPEPLG